MPIVLDASITVGWFFEDERTLGTDAILDSLTQETALVPAIWWFEIRNVITLGERRGRATGQQTAAFLEMLSQLPIRLDSIPDENAVLALARKHRLTFYDASYLELARREKIALATLDKALTTAAQTESVRLVQAAP